MSVEGKKIIFNDQLSRYSLNGGFIDAYKDGQKNSIFFKDFEEIVINIKSSSKEDTRYEDRGALAKWGGLTNSFGNAPVLTINLSEGKAKDNALALQGWRQRINAKQINITTDATEAAALHAGSGDFLILNVDKLNVFTKGNDNVIGLKVSPGKRSPNPGSAWDRPLADRYLTFGETAVTMEHGGVGVYIGFDEKDEEVVSSGLVVDNPKPFDNRYYLVSADLGNTVITLKGNPDNHIHGNVGLFAAGLGLIKTDDFTFLSTAENITATALRAEVNEDFYPEIGYIKKEPNLDPEKGSTGNFWEDSHRIVKAALISIKGAVNIKMSESEGNYAAKAGRDGTIEINPEAGSQPIKIVGAILADNSKALENKDIQDAYYGDNFQIVHNPASIVINANSKDSFLTSNIDVKDGGEVKLGLGNGAHWNVRGNSHVTQLNALEGNAYVDLTHESQTRNTVVIDDLQGSAQLTFVLHSDIKGKDAVGANDKVIIKSAGSDTQIHTLHIPSTGEPEAGETNGSYLVYVPQNVNVVLNETHHPDKNVSHRVVDKGLYLYTLASDKDVGTPDEIKTNLRSEDKYDAYYLTLAGFTPDNQQGGDDNKPVTPLLSPTAKAVLAMAGMGGQNAMYHNQLSDLRKRLGEVRGMTESNGLWVSASGQRDRFDGFASNGVKQNAYRFNLGLDHKIGSWLIGANFKYLHGTQKTSNPDSHAKGKVNSAGANIYGTWIAENGFYTDIVASFDHYHQKITTSMLDGRGVSGKVNNFGLGLSAEVGKKFGLTKDFFVEPQAQLAYYWIKGKDFSMSNGMKVEQDDFNSLVGRLGVVAGKDFKDAEGNTKGQVFVKGGVKQQFAGKQKLRANSVQFKDELKGTSGYYGLGFEANPNKKVSLYGHVERENGKHYTKEIEVMLGLRYKF